MSSKRLLEKELYGVVRNWVHDHFGCFATEVNRGTKFGRVDVVALRQVPGDHSSETEVLCVEVKRGTQPFLNALGQAAGYSVYGNACYLADYRPKESFSEIERGIAEQLGVGLIRISSNSKLELISTARRCLPIENFRLEIADQMGYVKCTICSTFFPRSEQNRNLYDWSRLEKDKLSRSRIREGIVNGKGFVYWPTDASAQDRTHDMRHRDGRVYNRRFLCHTCASLFIGD